MRDYRFVGPINPGPSREIKNEMIPKRPGSGAQKPDPVVQRHFGTTQPGLLGQFEGGSDADNTDVLGFQVVPPDTNGDVSATNYIQYINLIWLVYDKSGNLVLGPLPGNSFWQGFGGICETSNNGDPIVKYDRLAQRWVFTQFAFPATGTHQCFAISVTDDPTGSYYLYDFETSADAFVDYPHLSIWPDAFYMTSNNFGASFYGGNYAFERDKMLNGDPAQSIYFGVLNEGGFLSTDLDGTTPPPAGSPNYFFEWWDNTVGSFHWWKFHVDWATPANSTFIQQPDIIVDPFGWPLCGASRGACVPQKDTSTLLEDLSDRLMYRVAYRNFGDHESIVLNHTVDAGGGVGGIRWYEFRDPNGDLTVHQQGTFAPDSSTRWMGSIAMDRSGNMALGYSRSDATMFPAIGITGRLVGDPLGQMGDEDLFFSGTGSETDPGRWGDYSSISVDPVDDCTFWYTQEYYAVTTSFDFHTRVGSFKFPSCTSLPTGTLHGTVTDGSNPLAGVKVTAGASSTNTDASGSYSFTLPVGLYDMTASKYGYLPGSANGIDVTDGGNVVQNFTLGAAPSVTVNGVVKDGSGGGWPLYAKVVIKGSGAPTFTLYTDPVTGYYSQTVVSGISYTFTIDAVGPGYLQGGGVVPLRPVTMAPSATVVNWDLLADLLTCNAPGYSYPAGTLFETFSSGSLPAGWSVTNEGSGAVWEITASGDPCGWFGGNQTGGSGPYALANGNCSSLGTNTSLITPSVDMSALASPILRFNEDYKWGDDYADVDVSTDGGTSWTNVLSQTADAPGPQTMQIDISAVAAGQADVKARFHNYGNDFWAWWWQVDNVLMGDGVNGCAVQSGGLVVGNVLSANNNSGLNGATVENLTSGGSAKTFATPADTNNPDGFYILFSESGSNDLKASLSLYASDQHTTLVIPNSTVRQNFSLKSGSLSASPSPLNSRVNPGGTQDMMLNLTNTGGAAASFEMIEINAPVLTNVTSGFASEALRRQALARIPRDGNTRPDLARSAKDLPPLPGARPAGGRPLAAGDVLASYPTDITYGWGVDTSGANFWLSNIAAGGGDDKQYQYDSTTGAQTGNVIDDSSWVGVFVGDGAFNSSTGMMWSVNVGGDNCIYEINPASLSPTGNKICGSWTATSQRGLAYDPINNAFFVGGWNEGIVYHIDSTGAIMDSASVGLGISGLAYNATTGHLFVQVSDPVDFSISVLDALNNYAVVGTFQVGDGAFDDHGGAGMEFDCLGNLWMVNQNTQVVYNVAYGEPPAGCAVDIPWLSENPTEGTVPAAVGAGTTNPFPVTVSFDSLSYLPGLRQAQLQVKTDTPVQVPAIPVTLTVRFLDVPDSNQFQAFIYGAAGAGVMMGGPPTCPAGVLNFCPSGVVTRADMAGYLFRAINGSNTPPPVYQNIFGDVTFNQYNSFYIQGIFDAGITAGCGNGNYCPDAANTRAQMSVFIWKGQHGDTAPPACVGVFDDVPCPGGFAVDFIEGLYNEGVTAGCGGNNFCPDANITNGQMAVFLVKGFNIPYLP